MSKIKELLYQQQEEEQALWQAYLEFAEENKELFQQLSKPWSEVIGYEE